MGGYDHARHVATQAPVIWGWYVAKSRRTAPHPHPRPFFAKKVAKEELKSLHYTEEQHTNKLYFRTRDEIEIGISHHKSSKLMDPLLHTTSKSLNTHREIRAKVT